MKKLGKKIHSCKNTIEAYSYCPGTCSMDGSLCGNSTSDRVYYYQNDRYFWQIRLD